MRALLVIPSALVLLAAVLPDSPRVRLEALDGQTSELELAEFTTNDPREQGAHLIRFVGLQRGASPTGAAGDFLLASGDRLRGRVRGGKEEVLELEVVGGVSIALGIDSLRSVRFQERIPVGWESRLQPAPEGDRLYRKTRAGLDRIDGTLIQFSKSGVTLDGSLGEKLFAWEEVAALFVEVFEEEERVAEANDVPIVVDLVDSSRLGGTLVSLDADRLRMQFEGSELELPSWTVAELFVNDGRLQFLSDLTPSRVEEGSPFGDGLGMEWPYRVDRSVTGEPLRCDGETHTRGLGVHSPSRLTWELDGTFSSLRGRVALDDQVKRLAAKGSVIFRVLLDGEKAWESAIVRGGEPSVAIPPVSLGDAKELTLEVDMATDFHVADRANWVRVLLL